MFCVNQGTKKNNNTIMKARVHSKCNVESVKLCVFLVKNCFKISKELKFEAFKFGGLENYAYLCKQLKTNIILKQ